MRSKSATSCYFTPEERRAIERIADSEERDNSQIVRFAVRVFDAMYAEDRVRALDLAQRNWQGRQVSA